ncbi:SET domain-containing protein [Stagnimonas aquatica]|uniref:SET domain-containing protein n=1 Tax=Stagnimonas aquatica TaxID=2689987 RepID=A0A3N0V7J0_9GAMM|nr:SET domain-containing protein [Stagnimonas aquatica]ROH88693.1 SET domain-containing protein [Stagnimonas aquatica]
MILPRYRVEPSRIPGAGKGLFLDEPVARGRVIVAPDNIHTVWPEARLRQYPADSVEVESSVRWFEDQFSLTPEWSDECYVNHSFTPTALWHLGFIFAGDDLAAGIEVTVDYRLVIGSGEVMPFRDAVSGREIVGLDWQENLRSSAGRLLQLLA